MPATFPDAYKTRYQACAAGLFGTMRIAQDDKASRVAHMVKMTGGFGAPVIIYVIFHSDLAEPYSMFDLGAFTHAICLAAHKQRAGNLHRSPAGPLPEPDPRRLNLPASHKIAVGISLGYSDPAAPANTFRTDREAVENFVRWVS